MHIDVLLSGYVPTCPCSRKYSQIENEYQNVGEAGQVPPNEMKTLSTSCHRLFSKRNLFMVKLDLFCPDKVIVKRRSLDGLSSLFALYCALSFKI